jgi:hypothetical protein
MPKYETPEVFENKLQEGEPFFCMRARDSLSLITLYAYRNALIHHGKPEQAADIDKLTEAFSRWQHEHKDQVRLPD